jgi:hypothetical protein
LRWGARSRRRRRRFPACRHLRRHLGQWYKTFYGCKLCLFIIS